MLNFLAVSMKKCKTNGCKEPARSRGMCQKHYMISYHLRDPERERIYRKSFYRKNSEKFKKLNKSRSSYKAIWRSRKREADIAGSRKREREYNRNQYRTPRGRHYALTLAVRRDGKGSDITFEKHIKLLLKPCHYCRGVLNPTGSGLDRLDPKKGYYMRNVVPCCRGCNRFKSNRLTEEEALFLVGSLKNRRKRKHLWGEFT